MEQSQYEKNLAQCPLSVQILGRTHSLALAALSTSEAGSKYYYWTVVPTEGEIPEWQKKCWEVYDKTRDPKEASKYAPPSSESLFGNL